MKKKHKRHPLLGSTYGKIRGMIDQDYVEKLSDEDKEWLYKFNQTYYLDNIYQEMLENPSSNEAKESIGDDPTKQEYRRYLGRRNNARHRDIYARKGKDTKPLEWLSTTLTEDLYTENCMNLMLDYDIDETD